MPCYHPRSAWKSRVVNPGTGKYSLVFSPKLGQRNSALKIPCGQCIGCRLEKSRQWALRCELESRQYLHNCFLTLTYSDEHLPPGGHLDYDAPVLFMKRLRKEFGSGIRSFGCAEYGEKFSRPHYHLCIFNFDFPDKEVCGKSGEFDIFSSPSLSELWPFGRAIIGSFTFESAAYVARYCTKKVTGLKAVAHYQGRPPERTICISRRPGLGRKFYDEYFRDVFRDAHGFHMRGINMSPPVYFKNLFKVDKPVVAELLAAYRKSSGELRAHSDFLARGPRARIVSEKIKEMQFKLLKRSVENV